LRSWILLLGVAAAVFAGGCNDFNTTLGTPTNSSTISLLSPSGANAGGAAITLTIEGTGFLSNSVVEWNGSNRVTTYISGSVLLAQITTADLTTAGTVNILVNTPGSAVSDPSQGENVIATSNVVQFVIQSPGAALPVITGISPTSATAGGAAFTLTVFGTGFIPPVLTGPSQTTGSTISWNGLQVTTGCTLNSPVATATVNSAGTQASVMVPACLIATAEAPPGARITIFNPPTGNPATGGGTSLGNTYVSVTAGGGGNARAEALAQASASAANSLSPAISADTRYVAFVGPVPDPTTDASTGTDNVYVRDTCAGAPAGCTPSTALISAAADGSAADGESESPSMSADGRYVAFVSFADNLVAGGASGYGDIFLRDTCAGAPAGCVPATTLISVAAGGAFANGESESPSISASGRYVVFSSLATNLVMGTTTTSAEPEIYLRDLCVGAAAGCQASTIQLSVSSATSSLTSSSTSGTPTSNP
jgi:hypothetical protein